MITKKEILEELVKNGCRNVSCNGKTKRANILNNNGPYCPLYTICSTKIHDQNDTKAFAAKMLRTHYHTNTQENKLAELAEAQKAFDTANKEREKAGAKLDNVAQKFIGRLVLTNSYAGIRRVRALASHGYLACDVFKGGGKWEPAPDIAICDILSGTVIVLSLSDSERFQSGIWQPGK